MNRPGGVSGPAGFPETSTGGVTMVFDVSVALNWLLFLALFPISFIWARRAYRIFVRGDVSEVAIKRGVPPADPRRWAPYCGVLNLVGAGVLVYVIGAVGLGSLSYDAWTALAGITIWCKLILDFSISRHAHFPRATKRLSPGSRGG